MEPDRSVPTPYQTALFTVPRTGPGGDAASGSFVNNMRLPVHRWFRYSAGFSGAWATDLIANEANKRLTRVFDPFAGCGTTLVAAEHCNVDSWGIDAHPFVTRIAKAKLAYRSDPDEYLDHVHEVLEFAKYQPPNIDSYAPLIRKCYTDVALERLDALRAAVDNTPRGTESDQLVWLTLVSILRRTSHVGTANWQYLLPNIKKARVESPYVAFEEMAQRIYEDMGKSRRLYGPRATYIQDDARYCEMIPPEHFNLVVTSPPYPNNYDYADATRLELTFLGEVAGWSDLHGHVRRHLLRSCTQHVPDRSVNLGEVLASQELDPIRNELQSVCEQLGQVRLERGGRKTYHNMVACYFLDLAQVWHALRLVCQSPCKVCFVIGDSAPYGIYVPVMDWLGQLAIAAGFSSFSFEKIRDRNTKWLNRKHRVPLCEGRLWVEG